jgi:hypothetical protein
MRLRKGWGTKYSGGLRARGLSGAGLQTLAPDVSSLEFATEKRLYFEGSRVSNFPPDSGGILSIYCGVERGKTGRRSIDSDSSLRTNYFPYLLLHESV